VLGEDERQAHEVRSVLALSTYLSRPVAPGRRYGRSRCRLRAAPCLSPLSLEGATGPREKHGQLPASAGCNGSATCATSRGGYLRGRLLAPRAADGSGPCPEPRPSAGPREREISAYLARAMREAGSEGVQGVR
jgi:hypothetical protein